jgi:alkylated DNA nucleotide flippase Atl1
MSVTVDNPQTESRDPLILDKFVSRNTEPPLRTQRQKSMEDKVNKILAYLNREKIRCTYGAVAQALGVNARSVGQLLGERRPEASWVVNTKTLEPTDYGEGEKHPDLYRTSRIITSAEVLRRNLQL